MSLTITKGYLINQTDYDVFDEVITIINEHGNIFTLMARGVKKILSKNSRNLFFGCLSEFEFFSPRDIDNKIGKLKKVNLIENNIYLSYRKPLFLLNQIIFKIKTKGTNTFKLISSFIELIKKYDESHDEQLSLIALIKSLKILGIEVNLSSCKKCSNKSIISLCADDFGFFCKEHVDRNKINHFDGEIIKYLYLSNLEIIDKSNVVSNVTKNILLRILVDYINEFAGLNLYSYLFSSNKIT